MIYEGRQTVWINKFVMKLHYPDIEFKYISNSNSLIVEVVL